MMEAADNKKGQKYSRVDSDLEKLVQVTLDARDLSAKVSGTSEETAALFSKGLSITLVERR